MRVSIIPSRNTHLSVNKLEEITGMDFFPSLGDREEEIIEDQVDLRSWNINK